MQPVFNALHDVKQVLNSLLGQTHSIRPTSAATLPAEAAAPDTDSKSLVRLIPTSAAASRHRHAGLSTLPTTWCEPCAALSDVQQGTGGSSSGQQYVSVDVQAAGQPQEVLDIHVSPFTAEKGGVEAAALLQPQTTHQVSCVRQLSLATYWYPAHAAHHRLRLDLDTNLVSSTRASLEGSWQLKSSTVASLTVGKELQKCCGTGWSKGIAVEAQPSKRSKVLVRCLGERSFGVQWLARWCQQLNSSCRAEVEYLWHWQDGDCIAGASTQANRCLLLRLVAERSAGAAPSLRPGLTRDAASEQQNQHPDSMATPVLLVPAAVASATSGGTQGAAGVGAPSAALVDQQQDLRREQKLKPQQLQQQPWVVTLSCDPRAARLWTLHASLH